jgi:type IV conjugative transfer system protein TraE
MDRQKYASFLQNAVFKRQVWMVIASVMLISNVLLSLKILSTSTSEKTIIHPISMSQDYVIDGDEVDPLYINKLAIEFLQARFQYTPRTVSKQFDEIAKHFHPAIYGEKKAELGMYSADIIRNDVTSVFFPLSALVKDKTAYVEANITGYIGKKPITDHVVTLSVEFRNTGGRIWIVNWTEVVPDYTGNTYIPVDAGKSIFEKG